MLSWVCGSRAEERRQPACGLRCTCAQLDREVRAVGRSATEQGGVRRQVGSRLSSKCAAHHLILEREDADLPGQKGMVAGGQEGAQERDSPAGCGRTGCRGGGSVQGLQWEETDVVLLTEGWGSEVETSSGFGAWRLLATHGGRGQEGAR